MEKGGGGDALLELGEDLFDVALVREAVDDLELGEFDVDGVVVLAKEHLDVVLENEGSSLDDEEDVAERDVLDLVARRQQSHFGTAQGVSRRPAGFGEMGTHPEED